MSGCGTDSGKPPESLDCSCRTSMQCTSSECVNGMQTVTCTDLNRCSIDTEETKSCIALPASPSFGLEKVAGYTSGISAFFSNIGMNVSKIAKTPVFFIALASAILAALAAVFRRNVFNAVKGLQKYKIRFKIEKK